MDAPLLADGFEDLRETHTSWVFLTADRAYKVKKPVRFPFLDYGTLDRRRVACEREVELNRRLAPDIYVGVRSLVRAPGRALALATAKSPAAVEYAVEMRRFQERDTLNARLADGSAGPEELRTVGAWLAGFHGRAEVTGAGGAEAVMRPLDDTFASLLGLGCPQPGLQRFSAAFLAAHGERLDARAALGFVRDGHGDLRAEHVLLLPDGPIAVDCIEFSDTLRQIDVGADLAFLVMDLVRLGHPELVDSLWDGYRAAGGDPGDQRLVMFHAMARALVRAKVGLLRSHQQDAPENGEAQELIAVAHRLAWAARGPVIVAVAGLAASGKSTLARALAARCALPHLESDAVRREIGAGHQPPDDDETYAELLRRAAVPGGSIVVATFRQARHRAALQAAAAHAGARLLVVECVVADAELRRRARARAAAGDDISDADESVVDIHLREREPFTDLPARCHLPLRADRNAAALVAAVEAALEQEQVDERHAGVEPRPDG